MQINSQKGGQKSVPKSASYKINGLSNSKIGNDGKSTISIKLDNFFCFHENKFSRAVEL